MCPCLYVHINIQRVVAGHRQPFAVQRCLRCLTEPLANGRGRKVASRRCQEHGDRIKDDGVIFVMEILEIAVDGVLGENGGILVLETTEIEAGGPEGGEENRWTAATAGVVGHEFLTESHRLCHREFGVRPGIRRIARCREHFVRHADVRQEILEYVAAVEAEDGMVFRVREKDGVGVGDGCHVNHVHVALGAAAPDTLCPAQQRHACQPAFALIILENMMEALGVIGGTEYSGDRIIGNIVVHMGDLVNPVGEGIILAAEELSVAEIQRRLVKKPDEAGFRRPCSELFPGYGSFAAYSGDNTYRCRSAAAATDS